ncbi:MAG: DUF4434 domain-containing protein [Cytophagales bacterium]|nr:DUF4434 domain-containing protein [Cytophagales bacterium]
MKITGTFIDEISHDIPSANWGPEEWKKEFDVMKSIGIDTVILIRVGYKYKMTFNSKVLSEHGPMRPACHDLLKLFLYESERCGMKFFLGLYDSGKYWHQQKYHKEAELNLRLIEEILNKYGHYSSFKGWYLSHEMTTLDPGFLKEYHALIQKLKDLKDIPMLISPYVKGRMQFENPITPEEHEKQWDEIFAALSGKIDYVAFQDGQVDLMELKEFSGINKSLADKYGLISWANIETFERGMPINFLPISWENLHYKMSVARDIGVEKLITFEQPHFLSPNSMYHSAHNLYNRYLEWVYYNAEG